jgi:hypothetical protein
MLSPISLGYVDCDKVRQIWVRAGESEWVYDTIGAQESHDPMDRVGGPYRINEYVESEGDKWFLFACVDSYFPLRELVRGNSFEDAYETYIDFASEKRHLRIPPEAYADYDVESDSPNCSFDSSGNPVDTECIQGSEVQLSRLVF